ncbi:MAG: nitroreductase family protein [Nitrospiraceae bacterium]
MEKPAATTYPIHDLLRRRWSPRAFSARPVEPEKLRSLWEAARWAPSSFNEQPWSFIVATKEEQGGYNRLLHCLSEGNRVWAQQAPVLMFSVARLQFEDNGEPNRHAFHDVGLAVENLVVQATALGLSVHQMAAFDTEKARAAFLIPASHEPVAGLAIGYSGDPATLPERLRERELAQRNRKSITQFVFAERWGDPSSLVS